MRKAFISILFLSFISTSFGQQLVQNWNKHPLPSGDTVFQFNRSDTSWFIYLDEAGRLVAENKIATYPTVDTLPFKVLYDTTKPFVWRGFTTTKKVSNRYLVGFNKGEFGGSLNWFASNGSSSYRITSGNIHYIFEHNSKIFVAEGLAHTFDEGEIWEMKILAGKWKIRTIIKLPSCPDIIMKHGNRILIITTSTILFFNGTGNFDFIKKNAFWDILYPQSAVIIKDELYIGMRGGVYKINLRSKQEEWLMPD